MRRLATLLLLSLPLFAQNAALQTDPNPPFLDNNGKPVAGGKLYTCSAGTTCPGNPLATYTDITAGTPNANPVILDSTGRAPVYIGSSPYKFVLQNSLGVQIWVRDNITNNGLVLASRAVLTNPAGNAAQSIAGPINVAWPVTAKRLNSVIYADQYCATPGTYDQSCLANAMVAGPSNARIVLSPHTYNFASKVTVSNLSNVWIEGPGATISANGAAFECDNCTGGGIQDTQFVSATVPTVVTKAALPTGSQTTPVVIDRWSLGTGYYPTINDGDIVPMSLGGSCSTGCLSTQQLNFNYTTGVIYRNANSVTVTGLQGSYYYIAFYDSSRCVVSRNVVMGGAGPTVSNGGYSDGQGGIFFWHENGGTGNLDNVISNNTISYAATNGIMLAGGDHFAVTGNVVSYNGESGIKTYQNSPQQVSYSTFTGNVGKYNWFDGFDFGSTYPHAGTFLAHSIATGNHASFNHGAGFYTDGKEWVFSSNEATSNGTMGMGLDFQNSVISSNRSFGNNTVGATWHEIVICPGISCTGNVVNGNETNTNGIAGSYGIYSTMTSGTLTNNVEITGLNFFAGTAPHWFNYDTNGLDSSTGAYLGSQTYALTGAGAGSPAWYKLGTWSGASNSSTLKITVASGQGANSGSSQQAMTEIFVRGANSGSAPNLSGLTAVVLGSASSVTGVKAAATGGSTSTSNQSWDIYIQQGSFSGGTYSVMPPSGSTWANVNLSSSDPGVASSSVAVGTLYNIVDNSGAANFASYKVGGTSGANTTVACGAGQHIAGITVTNGIVTAVGACN